MGAAILECADEVTSDNDAASDGAADGGLDNDNDIVKIFDHEPITC